MCVCARLFSYGVRYGAITSGELWYIVKLVGEEDEGSQQLLVSDGIPFDSEDPTVMAALVYIIQQALESA